MSKCMDYWCEDYGKVSVRCERCEKKEKVEEQSDLRVILRRRADKLMELDNNQNKSQGQQR